MISQSVHSRYSMNQLFNEFLLLEREVESGGQPVDPELSRQVAENIWQQHICNFCSPSLEQMFDMFLFGRCPT